MKNSKLFVFLLIAYTFTCVLFVYSLKKQKKREMTFTNIIEEQEKSFYSLLITQIESGIIPEKLESTEILRNGKFVLAFPNNICDICNIWLFEQLKQCEKLDEIDIIVPLNMKKTMSVYNEIYGLNLSDVKYSNDLLLKDESSIYIFYYSNEGRVLFPYLLKEKSFDLDLYMDIVYEQMESD